MPAGKSLKKAALLLAVVAVVVLLGWWAAQRGATHPEFGKIYTAGMSRSYKDTETRWEKVVATVRRWLHMRKRPDPPRYGLPVGTAVLGWEMYHNVPPNRDGLIELCDAMHVRGPTELFQPAWEVALSDKRCLADVTSKDFDRKFYGMDDPEGYNAFRTKWRGFGIVVPEGQILFARLVTNRSVIYVVRLAHKGGPPNYGSMKIDYVIATNQVAR